MTWTCAYCHSNEHHGRDCPEKRAKEAAVREYWIIRSKKTHQWIGALGWTNNRNRAAAFTREGAHKYVSAYLWRKDAVFIHVTVRPAADRKALETKLEEARSLVPVWCFSVVSRGGHPMMACNHCQAAATVRSAVVHHPRCPVGRVLA